MSNSNGARVLRNALGQFTTGVAVVTTMGSDGRPLGLTINSFSSVSLAPPIVSWNLQERSANRQPFLEAMYFAINVLSSSQRTLARCFATSGVADRYSGLSWRPGIGEVPLLEGSLAWFECRRVSNQAVGDHELFLGQVLRCFSQSDDLPLVYWRGSYRQLGAPPDLERSPC